MPGRFLDSHYSSGWNIQGARWWLKSAEVKVGATKGGIDNLTQQRQAGRKRCPFLRSLCNPDQIEEGTVNSKKNSPELILSVNVPADQTRSVALE